MAEPFVFFSAADGPPHVVGQPRLASWDAANHPNQVRLQQFVTETAALVARDIEAAGAGALGVRLDVGLPDGVPLLEQHDLDNYLLPLVRGLAHRPIASVRASKRAAKESAVTVGPVARVAPPVHDSTLRTVVTTASAESVEYKRQISAQLSEAALLPDGPVALELAFIVGPGRSWLNLWKPTIDALDALLGRTVPGREWHPRDGRITELAMHCAVDPAAGHDVRIAIAATTVA